MPEVIYEAKIAQITTKPDKLGILTAKVVLEIEIPEPEERALLMDLQDSGKVTVTMTPKQQSECKSKHDDGREW